MRSGDVLGSSTMPTTRRNRSSSTTRALLAGTGKNSENSRRGRLEVELKRLKHARVHIVGPDEYGQFHDFPAVVMALDLADDVVGHFDTAVHGIGIGERGAAAPAAGFEAP